MSPSAELSDYLARSKTQFLQALQAGECSDWCIVMGNEAGDLDSIASAVALAFLRHEVQNKPSVPLVVTPSSDLNLRPENIHALALAGISEPALQLLCLDHIPATAPSAPMNFALVDHNSLLPRFAQSNPSARVLAIVDHHADEGCHLDADPRVVTVPCGSCTSLVAQLFAECASEQMPPELATLLLCGILIDTNGLDPGGKAEDVDRAAAAILARRSTLAQQDGANIGEHSPVYEAAPVQDLTRLLQSMKFDVGKLSAYDLLRRDYKQYSLSPSWGGGLVEVGLATVPLALSVWCSGDDFWTSVERWMNDRKLAVLGILTTFREEPSAKKPRGKHRREVLLVVKGKSDDELSRRLVSGIEGNDELQMKGKDLPHFGIVSGPPKDWVVKSWKQKNAHATRKMVAPLVKELVEGEGP